MNQLKPWLRSNLLLFAWLSTIVATAICVLGWGQQLEWNFGSINAYQLFPVFGLVAFAIMWGHYLTHAARLISGLPSSITKQYFQLTSYVVLACILLHPGILAWQLYQNKLGLPPGSYKMYIGASMYGFIVIGGIALAIFLSYELKRFFGGKNWWKYVSLASQFAMILIIVHALGIGGALNASWFKAAWIIMAIMLGAAYTIIALREYGPGAKAAKV